MTYREPSADGHPGLVSTPKSEPLVIDCDCCTRAGTATCDDCVVTYLVGREPGDAVVIDVATERAVRLMGQVGLVPTLKHRRRAGAGGEMSA